MQDDFSKQVAGLPLPGSGQTAERWWRLASLGRDDLVLARLAEGHADATAIRAELKDEPSADPDSERWGVWAAVPSSLEARRTEDGAWSVSGDRPWCSGAGSCTHALVTAVAEDGVRLFAVEVREPAATPLDDTWPAVGMAGSDSRTVRFADCPARPVGGPGDYVGRPGFWHGGVGVAACWYGGATGVADTLLAAARTRDLNPHALAHLGAVDGLLHTARLALRDAAERIDAEPSADAQQLAVRVRTVVDSVATQVLDHVGRALGAGPLCQDAAHARRVADLTVYLRQSHAEADLAQLGTLLKENPPAW
ncbi:acyl-CoA dehydrogenase [Actinoplanes friuliensis]|uniref:Acyl-CoA dehydrogenase n=1 Tax=Actinoplanes friuliensis DSM 7358 TaxID=1246995 RepID=U5W3X2_9ACTN|nr:acyl-CoA dehydrogenase [Actinoplanes friuliensis]AGZ42680.1 acyl-CoA dehydrogenase [Actinoplanes friuliensis DSM 7358]